MAGIPDTSPLDYSDSRVEATVGTTILAAIATTTVCLRFVARRLTRCALGWDDWLCLAALVFHHALFVASCIGTFEGGIGRDMRITATEDPNSVTVMFQSLFVAEITYTFSSPLIKLSVLVFYYRIFPTRFIKTGCWILSSMCVAWFLAIQILNFVQCRPLRAFWDIELQLLPTTQCLDPILCFFANSVANTIIDFFTLVLPIREVLKLHTSMKRKSQLCVVFLLGSVAFGASLARTVYSGEIWREGVTNFTLQFFAPGIATIIEIYVAIIGACLPLLVPVYRKIRYGEVDSTHAKGSYPKSSLPSSERSARMASKSRKQFSNNNITEGSFERLSGAENATIESYAMGDTQRLHNRS